MDVICAIFILTGYIIGSLSNVIIYRLPLILEKQNTFSLSFPASHCPECKTKLRFRDNIPIISYLVKKGACSYCHKHIPVFYLLVEAFTAILYLLIWYEYRSDIWHAAFNCLMASSFIIIAVVDLRTKKIYNATLIFMFFLIAGDLMLSGQDEFIHGLICLFSVYLTLFVFSIIMAMVMGKTAIGLGDVKYLAIISMWSGLSNLLIIIFTAAYLTLNVTCILKLRDFLSDNEQGLESENVKEIPFGPGISTACLLLLFLQPYIGVFF